MKKIFVLLLACAMLMGLCAIPAAAAETTVTVDYLDEDENPITSANSGDLVLVMISVFDLPESTSFALKFDYDKDLYDISEDESGWDFQSLPKATRKAVVLQDFDVAAGNAAAALKDKTVSGNMEACFCLALTAKADVANVEIGLNFQAKNGATETADVTITRTTAESVKIAGRTVIFNDAFQSRYVVEKAKVEGKTYSFTVNGTEVAATEVEINGTAYWGVLTDPVKPGAIDTKVTVALTVDGDTDTWTDDSIEQALKDAAAGTNATLAAAANATLAFANEAAKVNKTGKTYASVAAVTNQTYGAIAPHGTDVTGQNVKIVGSSLYLKGKGISLNFYVDPMDCTATDAKLKIGETEYSKTTENGGYWVFAVPVTLADMTTEFTATVTGTGVTSNAYKNSVVAYAADLAADADNATLAQAIMNYVYYAQAATNAAPAAKAAA